MKKKLNIYISHSSKMDYINELYEPLLNSSIALNNNLILPHSKEYEKINTKQIIMEADILVAEVSYPGTGIGLELGRAECNNVPIICFIKKGIKCNSSVSRNFKVMEYENASDMVERLENIITKIS